MEDTRTKNKRREYVPPEAGAGGGGRFSPDKAMGKLDGHRQRQLPAPPEAAAGDGGCFLAGGARAGAGGR